MNISKVRPINHTPLDDFPCDLFTDEQRRDGAIIFHILGAIYFFVLLAVVCNDYFLPSVECVCEDLNISKDVAAATFMAISSISPEFFTNIISSFVVESDVGLGGVLGSLMFNVLGVAAFAGMAVTDYIQLDWWPITRDSLLYALSVFILIWFTWDGEITLLESTVMVSLVIIYILVLIFNRHLMHCMKWIMEINLNCCRVNSYDVPTSFVESNLKRAISLQTDDLRKMTNMNEKPKSLHGSLSKSSLNDMPIFMIYADQSKSVENKDETEQKVDKSLWNFPMKSKLKTMWWIYTWPIKLSLTLTIPNPKTYRRWYPLTFVMCVIWIGLNSYMIIWMMTVIGFTFNIPEAVMGLTFLSFGNCMPEAFSSIFMIRKGERGFGVSNSLGSSTLDILLSLGLPWFVRNLLQWETNQNLSVHIESSGIGFTILLLFASVVVLYAILSSSKYRLSRPVGFVLILAYTVLAILSVSLEMDVFPTLAS
ncbi:sodium/potassium/calcium exchanger 4-like [Sitodiplosis mosellana]|uniref:sodium/potassium/calcium exchanger 4-like n=1 Tax=Sitodiplosis mosellana TaxID=263140 RepID=UPI002443B678|nr:sodium/potassium/calcium exchanger 4-like [Sitodiplosis mosellana]